MKIGKVGWELLKILGVEVDGTAMFAATIQINVNKNMTIKTEHFFRTDKKGGFVLNKEGTDLKRITKNYLFMGSNNETKKVGNDQ